MRQLGFLLILCALFVAACGSPEPPFRVADNSTIHVQSAQGPIAVTVEVMDTDAEWKKGMQGREELPEGYGMLFVFPDSKVHKFWMKDTPIPLDMLFFNAKRELIHIQHSVPPCTADPCPVFGPNAGVQYVLEVPAGWALENKVKFGDTLER